MNNILHGHTKPIQHLHYSQKYKYLFTASMDNQVLIWNPFVSRPVISIQGRFRCDVVETEIGDVIKSVGYPIQSPILSVMTAKNSLICYDMANYSKIYTKRFPGPSEAHLLTGYPMMFSQAAGITPFEFKEQNVIEAVTVTACNVSLKQLELYLAMESKLAIFSLKNFAFLGQKTFEEIGTIIGIELSSNHKFLVVMGSNLKVLYIKRSTFEVLATSLLDSKSEKVMGIFRVLEESFIQVVTPERMEILPPDRLVQAATDLTSDKMPLAQGVCQFSIEGLAIATADICRTLAVCVTLTGEVLLILFKQHKHYIVFFKLEEPFNIRQVKILGQMNHILFVDSGECSFILSIEEKYLSKPSFDFNICNSKDFFRVSKLKHKLEDAWETSQIGLLVEGAMEHDENHQSEISDWQTTRLFFDQTGNLHTFNIVEGSDSRQKAVGLYELQNYLKSHKFEYKMSALSSYRSTVLENQIRQGDKFIEVVSSYPDKTV